jgi:hypothetical protein
VSQERGPGGGGTSARALQGGCDMIYEVRGGRGSPRSALHSDDS